MEITRDPRPARHIVVTPELQQHVNDLSIDELWSVVRALLFINDSAPLTDAGEMLLSATVKTIGKMLD